MNIMDRTWPYQTHKGPSAFHPVDFCGYLWRMSFRFSDKMLSSLRRYLGPPNLVIPITLWRHLLLHTPEVLCFFVALLDFCLSRDWQFLNCQSQQGGKLTGDLFSDLQVMFKSPQREDSSQPLVQRKLWPSGPCPGLYEITGFQP